MSGNVTNPTGKILPYFLKFCGKLGTSNCSTGTQSPVKGPRPSCLRFSRGFFFSRVPVTILLMIYVSMFYCYLNSAISM